MIQVAIANALLGGTADETLSARAHRMRVKGHRCWGWTAAFVDGLFFWDRNHCLKAYQSEQARLQLPKAYRE